MQEKTNPFEFGRELRKNELVDRRDELEIIKRTVFEGRKLFVIGPRRFGKTSLLAAAEERCREQGSVVLRFNAESFPTLEGLTRAIIREAAKNLKGEIKQTLERVQKYFAVLRPELTLTMSQSNPLQTDWKVGLGLTSKPAKPEDEIELLAEAFNGLENLARELDVETGVALMLDEFQRVVELGGGNAEAQIRSAIQTHRRTGYVFAGSKTRILSEMTTSPARPFYRLGELLFVGEIPREDFLTFLLTSFAGGGFTVEGATGKDAAAGSAARFILNLAEDVPYNVQMLASGCWESLASIKANGKKAMLTEAVVRAALERIVHRYDPFYTQLWTSLTATQQRVLAATARENGTGMLSASVGKEIGLAASTIQKAMAALQDKELLRSTETGGNLRYRFEDPFFAQWIERFVQL